MSVLALPDLNALRAEALRALISTEDKLTATQEQLLSREREIEHLKLLFAKLHRMQFGRKSEKLERQIEQLELRLEELESNRSEKEKPPEPASGTVSSRATAAKPTRRALPDHLPRQTRRHGRRKGCVRSPRSTVETITAHYRQCSCVEPVRR
jgi:transposase